MSQHGERIVIGTNLTPRPALALDAAIVVVHALFLAFGFLVLLH